jgi:hypothetical protein
LTVLAASSSNQEWMGAYQVRIKFWLQAFSPADAAA